jgi:hypothetical protein
MLPPADYISYFATSVPREGPLSVPPGWFQLWSPQELERFNADYEVDEYAPGLCGFASSGGGEMLAFAGDGSVVMIPFVGMDAKLARPIAASWHEFVSLIGEHA